MHTQAQDAAVARTGVARNDVGSAAAVTERAATTEDGEERRKPSASRGRPGGLNRALAEVEVRREPGRSGPA